MAASRGRSVAFKWLAVLTVVFVHATYAQPTSPTTSDVAHVESNIFHHPRTPSNHVLSIPNSKTSLVLPSSSSGASMGPVPIVYLATGESCYYSVYKDAVDGYRRGEHVTLDFGGLKKPIETSSLSEVTESTVGYPHASVTLANGTKMPVATYRAIILTFAYSRAYVLFENGSVIPLHVYEGSIRIHRPTTFVPVPGLLHNIPSPVIGRVPTPMTGSATSTAEPPESEFTSSTASPFTLPPSTSASTSAATNPTTAKLSPAPEYVTTLVPVSPTPSTGFITHPNDMYQKVRGPDGFVYFVPIHSDGSVDPDADTLVLVRRPDGIVLGVPLGPNGEYDPNEPIYCVIEIPNGSYYAVLGPNDTIDTTKPVYKNVTLPDGTQVVVPVKVYGEYDPLLTITRPSSNEVLQAALPTGHRLDPSRGVYYKNGTHQPVYVSINDTMDPSKKIFAIAIRPDGKKYEVQLALASSQAQPTTSIQSLLPVSVQTGSGHPTVPVPTVKPPNYNLGHPQNSQPTSPQPQHDQSTVPVPTVKPPNYDLGHPQNSQPTSPQPQHDQSAGNVDPSKLSKTIEPAQSVPNQTGYTQQVTANPESAYSQFYSDQPSTVQPALQEPTSAPPHQSSQIKPHSVHFQSAQPLHPAEHVPLQLDQSQPPSHHTISGQTNQQGHPHSDLVQAITLQPKNSQQSPGHVHTVSPSTSTNSLQAPEGNQTALPEGTRTDERYFVFLNGSIYGAVVGENDVPNKTFFYLVPQSHEQSYEKPILHERDIDLNMVPLIRMVRPDGTDYDVQLRPMQQTSSLPNRKLPQLLTKIVAFDGSEYILPIGPNTKIMDNDIIYVKNVMPNGMAVAEPLGSDGKIAPFSNVYQRRPAPGGVLTVTPIRKYEDLDYHLPAYKPVTSKDGHVHTRQVYFAQPNAYAPISVSAEPRGLYQRITKPNGSTYTFPLLNANAVDPTSNVYQTVPRADGGSVGVPVSRNGVANTHQPIYQTILTPDNTQKEIALSPLDRLTANVPTYIKITRPDGTTSSVPVDIINPGNATPRLTPIEQIMLPKEIVQGWSGKWYLMNITSLNEISKEVQPDGTVVSLTTDKNPNSVSLIRDTDGTIYVEDIPVSGVITRRPSRPCSPHLSLNKPAHLHQHTHLEKSGLSHQHEQPNAHRH